MSRNNKSTISIILLFLIISACGGLDGYAEAQHSLNMPLILRNYCPDFFDDFSNPTSGWEIIDRDDVKKGYLNGEYRVWINEINKGYSAGSPTGSPDNCSRENYSVEVDAHWQDDIGSAYGVIFGATKELDAYLFLVFSNQNFALLRYDPLARNYLFIVPLTFSAAVNTGSLLNHLKVKRQGSSITLFVNGTELGTWDDRTITGLTAYGLASFSGSTPLADARFDNFRVMNLPTP
jgi:hypothetical protein